MKEAKAKGSVPKVEVKPRRKFDHAFKGEAVDLWVGSGKTAGQIAAELGIEERHLYLWKKKRAPQTPLPGHAESELAALRRENAQLRQRCDILKKTLGILSEPPSNGSSGSIR